MTISRLYLHSTSEESPEITVIVKNNKEFTIAGEDFTIEGHVGDLIERKDFSIKIDSIDAEPNTSFTVSYVSKLKAITDLQEVLSVADRARILEC